MNEENTLLSYEKAAQLLGIEERRIKQLIRDHILFYVYDENGKRVIPAEIIVQSSYGWEPLLNLSGTLTVLADCGFTIDESSRWLYTVNDELGETPLEALLAGRHHRVNNIARLLGF
ncbi:MAG: transcriptional regulator [Actinobacteria bacterium]|nr:MAG: transcriptional regulator [Actinomycetota bacterium]